MQIVGDWLPELGFDSGVLVQSLPEPDGLVLNLCNDNINYRDLYNETKAKGGVLNRMYVSNQRTSKGVTLVTTGKHLLVGGIELGDACIAKCEYGCIRVRKVEGNVRLLNAAKTKNPYTGELAPMVYIQGNWLNDIGFTPDTLMTVATEPGCITFTAHDKPIIYQEIVKYARKHKMQLIQVSTHIGVTLIKFGTKRVVDAGFSFGDIFLAEYEHGIIRLKKLATERFGFPEG